MFSLDRSVMWMSNNNQSKKVPAVHICVTSICHTDIGNSFNTFWPIMRLFAILAWCDCLFYYFWVHYCFIVCHILFSLQPPPPPLPPLGIIKVSSNQKTALGWIARLCTQFSLEAVKSGTFHTVCHSRSRLDAERRGSAGSARSCLKRWKTT